MELRAFSDGALEYEPDRHPLVALNLLHLLYLGREAGLQ